MHMSIDINNIQVLKKVRFFHCCQFSSQKISRYFHLRRCLNKFNIFRSNQMWPWLFSRDLVEEEGKEFH